MRIGLILLLLLTAAACNRGIQNKEAVRQGVIDYVSGRGSINVAGMDIDVTSVQFNGTQAEATVSFSPKGGDPKQGMSMKYQLEQQGNRWVVKGKQDSASNPHGLVAPPAGGAAPGTPNPHGDAGSAPASGGGKMPSPDSLPPVKKQ